MKMELKPSDNEVDKLVENLVGFKGKIYFGVPKETARMRPTKKYKSSGDIDNATLLCIMEHGSPVKNIPPRELLRPVLEKHMDKIREMFDQIYNCLVEGNEAGADKLMETLSQRVQAWAQAYFVEDNGWAANSPLTIKMKGSDKPLIDTGDLRKSIRGIYEKN